MGLDDSLDLPFLKRDGDGDDMFDLVGEGDK